MTDFTVSSRSGKHLKVIPYIGCKAGFKDVFDAIMPDDFGCRIYDVFGGGGSFSFYASDRFGSRHVNYNDNNPVVVNLIRQVQACPEKLWELYNEHYRKSTADYYYRVREMQIDETVEGAANFLYLAKNAFSGKIRFNSSNRFNSPIRKGSKCPKLKLDLLLQLSSSIQELAITNLDYRKFADVQDSLVYLDPPYFNNANRHYNAVLDLDEFKKFLRRVETRNKIALSEQNQPELFCLPESYTIRTITLNRSLQYATQSNSREIIACNYQLKEGNI